MIRRNTASQVIYLPPLLLIADGSAVTSGAALTVAKDGTEAAAAGSLAHSANGVWKYTPTQAETDAAIVALILTYSGASPVVLNLVTTGADTSAVALGANTTAPATPTNVSDVQTAVLEKLPAALVGGRIDASVGSMANNILTAAALAADAVAEIAAAIEGSGTGARTVTITVNDGAAALQNARVRLTEGANTYVATTNVSGVATFNVDDATYTVAITKSGYTYAGTTLLVNGDETATYSMTEVVVSPPSNPSLSAIEVLCLGADDTAESGIDVDFRIVTIPSGDQNKAYSGAKKTITSDGDGIARIEVAQGSTYEYKRGAAQVWSRVTVDADGVTNVTSFIGSP